MNNFMNINGYKAIINYDSEIEMFWGEFININGGADFYATDISGLHREGEMSLNMFLEMCKNDGVTPKKNYSGKFNVRLSPDLHADLVAVAASEGKSINQWVSESLSECVSHRV